MRVTHPVITLKEQVAGEIIVLFGTNSLSLVKLSAMG